MRGRGIFRHAITANDVGVPHFSGISVRGHLRGRYQDFEDVVVENSERRHLFDGYEADGFKWCLVEERAVRNRKRREVAEKAAVLLYISPSSELTRRIKRGPPVRVDRRVTRTFDLTLRHERWHRRRKTTTRRRNSLFCRRYLLVYLKKRSLKS